MKKILKSPMFWGSAIFLVIMFVSLTATSLPQIQYGAGNNQG